MPGWSRTRLTMLEDRLMEIFIMFPGLNLDRDVVKTEQNLCLVQILMMFLKCPWCSRSRCPRSMSTRCQDQRWLGV